MFQQSKEGVITQIDQQARALLQQVMITRTWIADHGGLFVEKRAGIEENPFLPGTEIEDRQGKIYLFRNPAMATREISEYAASAGLYSFRLTSLKLINPANRPLPFEEKALQYFGQYEYEQVKNGLSSEAWKNGARVYRRIVPLQVEESCLECHAEQGYEVGDIRGGLSVLIPMTMAMETIERNRNTLILSWVGIVSLVLSVIYFLLRQMVLKPVDHLHQVAHRLIDGEYNVKARISTGDEFEAFAHAFNNMTDRLKRGYEGTIKSLVAAIEARDPYTKGHTARVAKYSTAIAIEMGLSEEKVAEIALGATLHDIGKIGIEDEIIRKSVPLTDKEIEIMETHPQKGGAIIKDADFLLCALPAILYHHERPDGTGYPGCLKGDDLPLMARIIAVADTFDAMTTDRPYRKALRTEDAVKELEKHSAKQFDPDVVRAFRAAFNRKFRRN